MFYRTSLSFILKLLFDYLEKLKRLILPWESVKSSIAISPKNDNPRTPSITTWRPARGRMLTRAIFHWSPWLPLRCHTKVLPPLGVY